MGQPLIPRAKEQGGKMALSSKFCITIVTFAVETVLMQ